jgi:hypothetical protein
MVRRPGVRIAPYMKTRAFAKGGAVIPTANVVSSCIISGDGVSMEPPG